MDNILNFKNYEILNKVFSNEKLRQKIRLLCVFGCGAAEVIYATDEDKVYCFGRNRFGGLGLGSADVEITVPQLNPFLSQIQVSGIFFGFEHWLALTTNGVVYSWGHNDWGQLGIGSTESTATPKKIRVLSHDFIVDISCGGFHTLALTTNGQVYSWGDNRFGQLGNQSFETSAIPVNIFINEKVVSISCGKKHSMALTQNGKVYLWGINGYGQCAHSWTKFQSINKPQISPYLKAIEISKAICGPNHSLLLTTDGYIYSFGENTVGQIGNGTVEHEFIPNRIREDIKFKDIITNKENDLSIAVSKDNRIFVWGLAKNRRCMSPKEEESSEQSIFDVYTKYAKNKVTFKTVNVRTDINRQINVLNGLNIKSEPNDRHKLLDTLNEDLNYSNSCKRLQTVVKNQLKSIDNFLDVDNFLKNKSLIDENMRKSIRLFFVFGIYGSKVIFATNEDKVYAFGHNRDGTLGLGTTEEHILELKLNETLSGKQLVDICSGYEHCIGLTASGRCYGWGYNKYGQLGVGNIINQTTPQLIEELMDKTVVQIGCGSYHSLALTSDGELFSWGHNTFAQLGDKTYNSREIPTNVMINESIASISCGINHSLALTRSGFVYVWGVNESGQLGRERIHDLRPGRDKAMSNRPKLVPGIESTVFKKAVCGPNHSLLLTTDGYIYVFGHNKYGQIGNGLVVDQTRPFKLNNNIKIKDVITCFRNDLTIAVSTDNRCFVWGLVLNESVLRPQQISESLGNKLFDIYVKLAKNKVTFKAVNVSEDIDSYVIKCHELNPNKESLNLSVNQKNISPNYGSNEDFNQFYECKELSDNQSDEVFNDSDDLMIQIPEFHTNGRPDSAHSSNSVYNSSGFTNSEPITGDLFLKHLHKSFNNQINYDLAIKSEERVIYCHKTILMIRNDKFWQLINHRLSQLEPKSNEVLINAESFQSFHTFTQYLYGIEPEIDVNIIGDLLKMSEFFNEPELKDLCEEKLKSKNYTIEVSNVCYFYEIAINHRFKYLEESCIAFAVEKWKNIVSSEAFLSMDDKLSKRFMLSIHMR